MKLIIAGSRTLSVKCYFIDEMIRHFRIQKPTEVVSGKAIGVDSCGEAYAKEEGIHIKDFPYKSELGRAGGPVRNAEMADYGDALLLIWTGESSGSASMKKEMKKRGKPVYEIILKTHNLEDVL